MIFSWTITAMHKTATESKDPKERALNQMMLDYPNMPYSELSKIKAPVLIMSGDMDVIRPEHTLLIARNIPQSYAWILPNSGHSTPIFYKDEFNKKIEEFFSKPYRRIEGEAIFQ